MEIQDTKDYEIGFLSTSEEGKEAVVALIRKAEGEVILDGTFEKITLAYQIEKETSAYFGFVHARLVPSAIKELEREMKATPGIIRELIITPPFIKNKPRSMPRPAKGPVSSTAPEPRMSAAAPLPLSNEALEKRIEEILKQ